MLLSPISRMSKGRYVARLVESDADLRRAQRLRYQVFRGSDGAPEALDMDGFDAHCDHVLVEDSDSGALACCFRMMTMHDSASIKMSYAAQFYDLERLIGYGGPLVEIGRFCVRPELRDADILRVAWGAVTAHVDALGVRMLFGCSSFAGTSAQPHIEAFALLKKRYLGPDNLMPQVRSDTIFAFADELEDRQPEMRAAVKGLPPLLRTYLAMGGWVSDHAVIDTDLNTMHVFTGVEIAAIPAARARALRALTG